jgi:hypothetical protein
MKPDEEGRFSRTVTHFLEQQRVVGAAYSIFDEQLFTRFRAFWAQAPEQIDQGGLLWNWWNVGFVSNPAGNGHAGSV